MSVFVSILIIFASLVFIAYPFFKNPVKPVKQTGYKRDILFCPKCGTEKRKGDIFCSRCGANLTEKANNDE